MTTEHKHEPYSHHGHTFRCACGATSPSGAGPWTDDGTRGCAVCARPTTETGPEPLCAYHRAIAPEAHAPAIDHPSYKRTDEATAAAVARLIDESIETDRIVHADHSDALAGALAEECEGDARNGHVHEFWGVSVEATEEGDVRHAWRIHLDCVDDAE